MFGKPPACKAATMSARWASTERWLIEPLSVISPLSMVGGSLSKHSLAIRLALPVAVVANSLTMA